MNFVQQCIVCKKLENLTHMTIKIVDADHNIFICEEHAEECSLKNLKEIINNKIEQFKTLKQQMINLGIDFTKKSEKKILEKPPTSQPQMIKEGTTKPPKQPVVQRQIRTSGSHPEAKSYQSHDVDGAAEKEAKLLSERTGRDVKVAKTVEREEQEVEGICKTNMIIPKRLKSSDGSITNISIVKTSNADIMRRIDPENGIIPPKDCSICRGTGKVNRGNNNCPKCKGTGFL